MALIGFYPTQVRTKQRRRESPEPRGSIKLSVWGVVATRPWHACHAAHLVRRAQVSTAMHAEGALVRSPSAPALSPITSRSLRSDHHQALRNHRPNQALRQKGSGRHRTMTCLPLVPVRPSGNHLFESPLLWVSWSFSCWQGGALSAVVQVTQPSLGTSTPSTGKRSSLHLTGSFCATPTEGTDWKWSLIPTTSGALGTTYLCGPSHDTAEPSVRRLLHVNPRW